MKKYCVLFLLVASFGHSQVNALYKQISTAYKTGDYVLFLKLNKQLDSIRPSHPTVMYNLAAGYALNKMEPEAVAALNQLVVMDNSAIFEEDVDFDFIRNMEGFKKAKELKAAQGKVIANSIEKLTLSQKDLHPESVIYLEKHKLWLASSIRNKKIVSFDGKGNCTDWFTDIRYSVFAMKTDPSQNYLWVATSAIPEMKGYNPAMEGQNQILKIEISSKKIVESHSMQGNHIFGDLIVSKNGEVYVSDSAEALIYRIKDGTFLIWNDLKKKALNLQGMAFNDDESKLFIADYLKGILMISMKENQPIAWIDFPEGTTKKGIDGLVFYKNSLLAVHNGSIPIRLVKYQLNAENTKIIKYTVLDNNRPIFNEPALASVAKGKLYFFANSPWKFYDASGNLDVSKFEAPKLFELKLD